MTAALASSIWMHATGSRYTGGLQPAAPRKRKSATKGRLPSAILTVAFSAKNVGTAARAAHATTKALRIGAPFVCVHSIGSRINATMVAPEVWMGLKRTQPLRYRATHRAAKTEMIQPSERAFLPDVTRANATATTAGGKYTIDSMGVFQSASSDGKGRLRIRG